MQFSHYATFDLYMDKALGPHGWFTHQRESWVWIAGRFVPYPFQNNLHRLPPDIRWKCIEGLLEVYNNHSRTTAKDDSPDFETWISHTFGTGLAQVFFYPYNFKVWAHPLSLLSAKWVGERVSTPSLPRVLKSVCLEEDDVSWGPNSTFRFPRHGGTGAIWRSLANTLPMENILLDTEVVSIDPRSQEVAFANGNRVNYNYLVSTMPLDRLVRISGLTHLYPAAEKLLYSSTHVIGIGLRNKPPRCLEKKCWMYFPEPDCPFYRVTVFSNYSPFNVPDPNRYWSLMAEVAESTYKPVDRHSVVSETVSALVRHRLIVHSEDVVCTWHRRLDHGYPVPGIHRDAALAVLLPALERYNIYSRGRFGAWKYEVSNQDHSFSQGREIIDRLFDKIDAEAGPEPTLNRPNWVNSRRNP